MALNVGMHVLYNFATTTRSGVVSEVGEREMLVIPDLPVCGTHAPLLLSEDWVYSSIQLTIEQLLTHASEEVRALGLTLAESRTD